jgi:glycosyltransferase involved in cell wall biosynthesis
LEHHLEYIPGNVNKNRILIYGGTGGSGGFISYCKGLFGSASIPSDVEVCFICSSEFFIELGALDSSIQVIIHPWMSSHSRFKRLLWNLWLYPCLLRRVKADIEFYPSGVLPLFRIIWPGHVIMATTCHNLLPFDLKELNDQCDNLDYKVMSRLRKRLLRSYNRVAGIIFLSTYSKNVVLEQLNSHSQAKVISHGLDLDYRVNESRSYETGSTVTLLYVSPIFPYKHHASVVRAVKNVRNITGRNVNLRLVGGGSLSSVLELENLIKREQAELYVTLVGKLRREDLQHELASADIFIFASSCETFGITLLEAMGYRLPIACSSRSGLEALLRDAGIYFDPYDVMSISQAITTLMSSEELRRKCGEMAVEYSREYAWEKSVQSTFCFLSGLLTY